MRGYKAFNKDLTCRGMQYEVGKEYKFNGEPIPCRQGFHFCETIADCYEFYPMSDDTRICEVEATGDIAKDGIKRVTNVIKILAEITCDNLRKGNTGTSNSGYSNSGVWNSGDWNSGDWNCGNRSSGVFCTEKQPTIKIFDVQTDWTFDDWTDSEAYKVMSKCPYSYSDYIGADDMTDEEKERHPEYKTIGGYVKTFTATAEDKQKWWDNLSKSDKNEVKALPNFDADKFCECVGIEHL